MSSHDGFAGGAARQTRRYVEDWPSTASPDPDPLDVRFQRAACEPIGRIHNLRRIPPNKEQSAATCNTMRSARSNATNHWGLEKRGCRCQRAPRGYRWQLPLPPISPRSVVRVVGKSGRMFPLRPMPGPGPFSEMAALISDVRC